MKTIIEDLIKLVEKKYKYHENFGNQKEHKYWLKNEPYLEGILDEVQEVRDEIKKNNSVYLEDELGDILYDYVNLIYALEKEGYIENISNVFDRSRKKLTARVDDPKNWNKIKAGQKIELKNEHCEKYGE